MPTVAPFTVSVAPSPSPRVLACLLLWTAMSSVATAAQGKLMASTAAVTSTVVSGEREAVPSPVLHPTGQLHGTVRDLSEAAVPGAVVTLENGNSAARQSTQSEVDGGFSFAHLAPGSYKVTVSTPGFDAWSSSATVEAGRAVELPTIALAVSPVSSVVEVRASSTEVAEAQMRLAEQQRVLGVFPNFYASYIWNADPLSAKQKFRLAWRFSVDPVAFGMAGFVAGMEQSGNSFSGYGRGFGGFGKRFGASYTDGFSSTMLGQAIFPAAFHQDPRYFVKGTGTVASRALYAIATTVLCKGDNRRWQPNYSNVLGNVASASLSNAYYPASNRNGISLTLQNSLTTTALGAVGGLIQEFMLHRMTPHIPDYAGVSAQ